MLKVKFVFLQQKVSTANQREWTRIFFIRVDQRVFAVKN